MRIKRTRNKKTRLERDLYTTMTFTLENAAPVYNSCLEIYKNKEVLDNIMYIALKLNRKVF